MSKTVTVIRTGSSIGCTQKQKATLIGLGLRKINHTRELEDTPAVRGMVEKIEHLVRIEEKA